MMIACGSKKELVKPDLSPKNEETSQVENKPQKTQEETKPVDKQIFSIVPYDINNIDLSVLIPPVDTDDPNDTLIKKNGYRIQVSVLSDFTRAKEFESKLNELLKNSFHSVYVDFYSPNFRIRIGDFETRDDARKVLPLIKDLGYKDSFVVPDIITIIKSNTPE